MHGIMRIAADEEVELLTLRRSALLLGITSAKFTSISKLIDADYPSHERLVFVPTDYAVTVDHVALTQAVARMACNA